MDLKKLFREHPSYLDNGIGYLAKKFNTTIEEIKRAKDIVKKEGVNYKRPDNTKNTVSTSKILLLDIETSPLLTYLWGIWNQNVNLNAIQSEWFIITWAAKWYGYEEILTGKLTKEEILEQNDFRILKEIWNLVNEAEIIITYNGDKFDMKRLNTRFLLHGLSKPLPYHSIDLLKEVRKNFNFTSNKLDYINKQLNIGRKVEHEGLELWLKCMRGEQQALNTMEVYNIGDVFILEELYNKLKSWIKGHPVLHKESNKCPVCGSTKLIKKGTFGKTVKHQIYRCTCGAIIKENKNNNTIL